MEEKKLYAFCRLPEAKKQLYNSLLAIKNPKNMTSEEKALDNQAFKGKSTIRCPRVGNFNFEDGTQICFDLSRNAKYEIEVYVAAAEKRNFEIYEYGENSIQKVWDITPDGLSTTYVCVFLENNTAKARKAWFNTMSEAEYDVLDKILTKSHLCDIFEVRQDEYGDYIWCGEDNTKMSMKYGLDEICEGMADWRECYGLTDEDLDVFNALLKRYGLDYYFD